MESDSDDEPLVFKRTPVSSTSQIKPPPKVLNPAKEKLELDKVSLQAKFKPEHNKVPIQAKSKPEHDKATTQGKAKPEQEQSSTQASAKSDNESRPTQGKFKPEQPKPSESLKTSMLSATAKQLTPEKKLPPPKPEPVASASANEESESEEDEDDESYGSESDCDDTALVESHKSAKNGVKKLTPAEKRLSGNKRPIQSSKSSDSEDDDIPLAHRAKVTKASSGPKTPKKSPRAAITVPKRGVKEAKTHDAKKRKSDSPSTGNGELKWTTLEHNGVIFPPAYTPHGIKILYKGKPVELTAEQEEVATMYAVMRETDYASKSVFVKNFWNDWKEILGPRHTIQRLEDCDFTPIWEWHLEEKEKKKQLTTEDKKRMKEEKLKVEDKYMWAVLDGVREKVGNFRVEPPGLFRGRGEHPKMGKLKKRIYPEDITINIGKEAAIPESPIPGHRWKEVRHDRTVTWLAFWNDPINPREFKYVFLAASSSLKGLSDKEKYEKARKLKDYIDDIRATYTRDFDSADMAKKQIAVATYLIDRLALRAGNEKDEDEADTVGCCSLKVDHIELVPPKSLQFDFLGKDSIRYFNTVEVEPKVYKAVGEFRKGKRKGDDLFDRLDTTKLNVHLKEIMPSLTAKVFRTYNASITLDMLLQGTVGQSVLEKVADYQRANKEVAVLCNHQRSVSKAHAGQMEKLGTKMSELETIVGELEEDLDRAKKGKAPLKRESDGPKKNLSVESLEKKIAQTKARIAKMTLDMSVKEDLKTVALGTSKINYMDPRITVAWCKKHEVPIEKVFNKSLLAKFAWAMDVEPDYRF